MATSSSDNHILDLLQQVECAAENYPLVVWLTRIAINSLTDDDNGRINASEERDTTYAVNRSQKHSVAPLHSNAHQSLPGGHFNQTDDSATT